MKNITQLPYLYRDASNYKAHAFIYLEGRLHNAAISNLESKLEGGDGFIPFDPCHRPSKPGRSGPG